MQRRNSAFSVGSISQLSISQFKRMGTKEEHKRPSSIRKLDLYQEKVVTERNFIDKLEAPFRFVIVA